MRGIGFQKNRNGDGKVFLPRCLRPKSCEDLTVFPPLMAFDVPRVLVSCWVALAVPRVRWVDGCSIRPRAWQPSGELLALLRAVVTAAAERLPVGLIEEQTTIAFVRGDVVDQLRGLQITELFANDAERMSRKPSLAAVAPGGSVIQVRERSALVALRCWLAMRGVHELVVAQCLVTTEFSSMSMLSRISQSQ